MSSVYAFRCNQSFSRFFILDLALAHYDIAEAYCAHKKWEEALAHYLQSIQIQEIQLPTTHSDLLKSYLSIAESYDALGKTEEAARYRTKGQATDPK